MKKFYVTTPIYYINDVPHIGHTCTTVAADILARLHRQCGEEVFFLTGTDEHGQKVAECAEKEGLEPKAYCDKIAPTFENAWKNLKISHDFFIRTTDPRHEAVVTKLLSSIYDAGDVYKAKYEGYYCVGCEKFLTETDLADGHCPLHPPEKTVKKSEENWFFRLSKYIPQIINKIETENYVFPEGKRQEVLAKLKAGVNDISLSRENVSWGIPLPWDKSQTVYVWFDALINYYSATQFLEGKSGFWPADIHLLGKEILWFHTVIWQAMLLSAGIELPKKTYTHSFYMIDGQKMSKSLGNVISPGKLAELLGIDGTRYLIARSFPVENDSDVGIGRFVEKYNADLANNLGNLVSRLSRLNEESKIKFAEENMKLDANYVDLIDHLQFDEAIRYVFERYVDKVNLSLNQQTPWKLTADDPVRRKVITEGIANLCTAAFHLKAVMPEVSVKIIETFTTGEKLTTPLFPRLAVTATPAENLAGKILVGRVEKVEKLTDETIQLIHTSVGARSFKIVCSDLSLKVGEKVPVALPGAEVYSPKGGLCKVKKTKVHGVESEAMLCSGLELGENDDHVIIFRSISQSQNLGTTIELKKTLLVIDPWVKKLGIVTECFEIGTKAYDKLDYDVVRKFVDEETKKELENWTEDKFNNNPILNAYREIRTKLPTGVIYPGSSAEWLVRYLLDKKQLPRVNPIVDLYNLVSLQTLLSIGVHDPKRLKGQINLAKTTGKETFIPIGAQTSEVVPPGVYAYLDDEQKRVICLLEAKQSNETKVGKRSTKLLVILQGNSATDRQLLVVAKEKLIKYLEFFC